jgi:hypothetical protein
MPPEMLAAFDLGYNLTASLDLPTYAFESVR